VTGRSALESPARLARDGFVDNVENPHHRTAKLISVTAAGRKALRKVEAHHAAWANRLGERIVAGRTAPSAQSARRRRDSPRS
jgi:hypothetical protein